MADPLVRLDTERAAVQPGGQTSLTLTVTNPGTVVEGYQLLVLGAAAPWAQVLPAELSVYPQQEATATVVFSPPSGPGAPGGTQPFGVLARSTLDPAVSASAEGDLDVGEVYGLQTKLIPVTSKGRWRGRHVIQVSNTGNTPASLRLVASNPDEALGFYLQPEVVELPVQGRVTVRLTARTRHPFLRGTPVRLPFQVVGERLDEPAGTAPAPASPYGDPSRPVVDGALSQVPILSRTFVSVVSLLLVGVVGLGAYLLLRHQETPVVSVSPLAPGTPAGFAAAATGPDAVTLSWTKADFVDHYTRLSIDPATQATFDSQPVPGAVSQLPLTGLTPATQYCFQLTATRGTATSAPTPTVCATTAAPSPSPSPSASASAGSPSPPASSASPSASSTPSPSVTPGDPATDPIMRQRWVLVLDREPAAAVPEAQVQEIATNLADAAALDLAYLSTTTYPRLLVDGPSPTTGGGPAAPEWMVYVRAPFPTAADAAAQCPTIQAGTGGTGVCVAVQPDPPQ